jgi:ABC-type nitrate/sulfonate/bicarbonate transport system substrate-binding protein
MTEGSTGRPPVGRRTVLRVAAAGLGAAALGRPYVARSAQAVRISIGRQPYAAGNSPVTQYMLENKLFERHAADLGYDVTPDYRDYPSALPQVEAFVSGNLDLGMWGNTPIIRGIASGQPWSVLNVGEGHMRFVIATHPDSGIRNLGDLKGKTVGALLGGDPYNALSQMLLYQVGSADPRAEGIRIFNTPTQAQAASVPRGMDASSTIYPAFLLAQRDAGIVGIVNSFGDTEAYYKGPAGEGAGVQLPSVHKSPFYPEGFYLHRSFWVTQNRLIATHPMLLVAFICAQQEAVAKLTAMQPGAVSDLVKKYWGLPSDLGAKVVQDELLFIRGWIWPTEGDVKSLLVTSNFMAEGKMIEKPLTWQQIKDNVGRAAPLIQQAYLRMGRKPDEAAFVAKNVKDLRGLPVWQMSHWSNPT